MAHGVGRSGDLTAEQPKARNGSWARRRRAMPVVSAKTGSQLTWPLSPLITCGDLAAFQAAGSSLIGKLSAVLVADALRIAGMKDLGAVCSPMFAILQSHPSATIFQTSFSVSALKYV